jgi:hypothetical protein
MDRTRQKPVLEISEVISIPKETSNEYSSTIIDLSRYLILAEPAGAAC